MLQVEKRQDWKKSNENLVKIVKKSLKENGSIGASISLLMKKHIYLTTNTGNVTTAIA